MKLQESTSTMKKTYLYTFLPTKKEEMDVSSASGVTNSNQVPRILIEIRDDSTVPTMLMPNLDSKDNVDNKYDPWRIWKCLDVNEVTTGKIRLTHDDVFEHVFRYSSLENANKIVTGNKVHVSVCDLTDENAPVVYGPYDEKTFIEKGAQDDYVLGVNMDLFKTRGFKKDDKIGIYYDHRNQVFYLKAFDQSICYLIGLSIVTKDFG